MKRSFLVLSLALISAAPLSIVAACVQNDNPPACNALAACCGSPSIDDPSSCYETATGGNETDAACGEQLAMYQMGGMCPVDAGFDADGGDGAPPKG
jgi:hypothetical protein